mmetsp:Transcript_107721/g.303465  ORF Transcript_107721/g.303465 Transcript_107721/m.303465 type:complete len:221 (+) Transcript_107721:444-1106(+)
MVLVAAKVLHRNVIKLLQRRSGQGFIIGLHVVVPKHRLVPLQEAEFRRTQKGPIENELGQQRSSWRNERHVVILSAEEQQCRSHGCGLRPIEGHVAADKTVATGKTHEVHWGAGPTRLDAKDHGVEVRRVAEKVKARRAEATRAARTRPALLEDGDAPTPLQEALVRGGAGQVRRVAIEAWAYQDDRRVGGQLGWSTALTVGIAFCSSEPAHHDIVVASV